MNYLAAGVVLVGLLCLLDLLMTVGVIRRLRVYERGGGHGAHRHEMPGSPPGTRVAEFAADTLTGGRVARAELGDRTLVGFLSPSCDVCKGLLPRFIEHARDYPRAFAVVEGADPADAGVYGEHLAPVMDVVAEERHGPMHQAFNVTAYPLVYVLDADGTVISSGVDVDLLTSSAHGH